MTKTIKEILTAQFGRARNSDRKVDRACQLIEGELNDRILDSCCSIEKQLASLPRDRIRESIKHLVYGKS